MKRLYHILDKIRTQVNKLVIHDLKGEGFFITSERGKVRIDAEGPLGALYGFNHFETRGKSGHLSEQSGRQRPRFPLRPLWLTEGETLAFGQEMSCRIPYPLIKCETEQMLEEFSFHVLSMGYNTLILGDLDDNDQSEVTSSDRLPFSLSQIVTVLKECGLQVIIKPILKKNDFECIERILKDMQHRIPDLYGIFWSANFLRKSESLAIDLAIEEMQRVETFLNPGISLIYFLKTENQEKGKRQAAWIPDLLDQAGKKTIIAFPAVAGHPDALHRSLHPLWTALRESPDISSTPLLPIASVAPLKLEGGSISIFPLQLLSALFSRCYRHPFAGLAIRASTIFEKDSLFQFPLWVSGQAMWSSLTVELLAETWFQAFGKNESCPRLFEDAFRIALEIGRLDELSKRPEGHCSDEIRLISAQLNVQLTTMEKMLSPCLQAEFVLSFVNEARRCLIHLLEAANLSTANIPLANFN